jgi:hypothetical protein
MRDGSHGDGFCHLCATNPTTPELEAELGQWATVYSTVRPHQALGFLTPKEFLDDWNQQHTTKEEFSRR